jgi:hypothetical protein
MRLWSLHPRYLDSKGLTAVWREGLLAKKVLESGTVGYRHHPQLERFKQQPDPLAAINVYLEGVLTEARRRGYNFDEGKIEQGKVCPLIEIHRGQLQYEMEHLRRKLELRAPQQLESNRKIGEVQAHPLFRVVEGKIESWEKVDF